MKCPNCGKDIEIESMRLMWRGVANVKGYESLKKFHEDGTEWTVYDSRWEECKCPYCKEYFCPDFVLLREEIDALNAKRRNHE